MSNSINNSTAFAEAKKLCAEGLCKYEISVILGITEEECQRQLAYWNLVATSKKKRIDDLIKAGEHEVVVSEKLGCTLSYIRQILQTIAGSGVIVVERVQKRTLQDTITLPNVTIDGKDFTKIAVDFGLHPLQRNAIETLYEIPDTIEKRQFIAVQRQSLWRKGVPAIRLLSSYTNNKPTDESWGVEIH
jgi:hypothetical protein